jgi:hypothetical protein
MNIKNVTPQKTLKVVKIATLKKWVEPCGVAYLSPGTIGYNPYVMPRGAYSHSGSMILYMKFSLFQTNNIWQTSLDFQTGGCAKLLVESWLPKGGKLPVCKARGFKTELGRKGNPSLHPPFVV